MDEAAAITAFGTKPVRDAVFAYDGMFFPAASKFPEVIDPARRPDILAEFKAVQGQLGMQYAVIAHLVREELVGWERT